MHLRYKGNTWRRGKLHSAARSRGTAGVCRELLGSVSAFLILAVAALPCSAGETVADCGGLSTSFEFNEYIASSVHPSIPPHQQREFMDDFCTEVANVRSWFVQYQWLPAQNVAPLPPLPTGGTYLPRTQLQIYVSNEYKISKSLVPAWSGLRGSMEFPAARAVVREAAIAHELAHVYFPNGNRMLGEGLPVYLQHKIGKNPAFPDFGLNLHQIVRDITCPRGPIPNGLSLISLVSLDRIATPDILTLRVGRTPIENSAFLYPIAGSFVQFLLENLGSTETPDSRMEKFRKLYEQTPLVPLEREPGQSDRWQNVYNQSLASIEPQWKQVIESKTCP